MDPLTRHIIEALAVAIAGYVIGRGLRGLRR